MRLFVVVQAPAGRCRLVQQHLTFIEPLFLLDDPLTWHHVYYLPLSHGFWAPLRLPLRRPESSRLLRRQRQILEAFFVYVKGIDLVPLPLLE